MGKLTDRITAPTLKIGTRFTVGQRADLDGTALPAQAGALPEPLQVIARNYIGARRRSGEALLDMCRWLNEAHELAKHGEWKIFLEATSTSDDTAERLLNIHRLAMANTQYADAIARNWLTQSTAALLARESTPPELVDQALSAPEPPTKRQIESSIRVTKIRTGADFDDAPPPPERRGTRLGPGQPPPAPWPAAPDGWQWNRRGAPAHLIAPDGWKTHDYNYPERALAEAQRRILSTPKAERETGADRRAYESAEAADQALITNGAGGSVQVATWQAAQAQRQIAITAARAYVTQERARLVHAPSYTMIRLPDYHTALDHIDALIALLEEGGSPPAT